MPYRHMKKPTLLFYLSRSAGSPRLLAQRCCRLMRCPARPLLRVDQTSRTWGATGAPDPRWKSGYPGMAPRSPSPFKPAGVLSENPGTRNVPLTTC